MKNINEMTYREIQAELKEYKKQGLTDIKLNQSYTILETELLEIRQGFTEPEDIITIEEVEAFEDDVLEVEAVAVKMETEQPTIQQQYSRLSEVKITQQSLNSSCHNFLYWQRLAAFLNNKKSYKVYSRKA